MAGSGWKGEERRGKGILGCWTTCTGMANWDRGIGLLWDRRSNEHLSEHVCITATQIASYEEWYRYIASAPMLRFNYL